MMSCSKKCNVNVSHTVHTARQLFHSPKRKKKKNSSKQQCTKLFMLTGIG